MAMVWLLVPMVGKMGKEMETFFLPLAMDDNDKRTGERVS